MQVLPDGAITLVFQDDPLVLKQWIVLDAQADNLATIAEPAEAAASVGLRYVSDQRPGVETDRLQVAGRMPIPLTSW